MIDARMSLHNGHKGDSLVGLAGPGLQLVERRDQLDLLHAVFERARDRQGSAVLITGEAGIGKTTLVKAFQSELGESKSLSRSM